MKCLANGKRQSHRSCTSDSVVDHQVDLHNCVAFDSLGCAPRVKRSG